MERTSAMEFEGELAYVLKGYPRLSETFILNEMLRLEELGFRLRIYALRDPKESKVHANVARIAAPVHYIPDYFWPFFRQIVGANLALFLDRPRLYWRHFREAALRSLARRSSSTIKRFAQAGYLVQRHLRDDPAPHLHAHFAHGPATVALYAAALTGASHSFTAHAKDIYLQEEDFLRKKLREARFVVTCTGFNRATLEGVEPAAEIHRIYHGVDLEMFRPRPEAPRSPEPRILSVGRLVPKKGFGVLVRALERLRDRGRAFRCHIVGGGPLRGALREQIRAAGLEGRVELVGQRTQEELLEYYRAADCVTLACEVQEDGDRDGIPNVLVEAAAVGVPIVSTRISGIPELIRDGETGLLVDSGDPEALADALERILGEPDLAERLARAGVERVRVEYDVLANTRRLGEVFREALQGGRAPGLAEGAASVPTAPGAALRPGSRAGALR